MENRTSICNPEKIKSFSDCWRHQKLVADVNLADIMVPINYTAINLISAGNYLKDEKYYRDKHLNNTWVQ